MRRGEVWWADLPVPRGSEAGYRRPLLIISANDFNASSIQTVTCAALSTNLRLATAPGNVQLEAGEGGTTRVTIVNVSQLLTVDRRLLDEPAGALAPKTMKRVDAGLRLALEL
jgi:mRNA interferase MazF